MSTIITVTNVSSTDVDQSGINPVEIYLAPTLGVDTSGITDAVLEAKEYAERAETAAGDAETSATTAEQHKDAAEAAEAQTAADVATTNTNVGLTNADVVTTGNNVTATNADAAQTAADVVTTNTNVALTDADVVDSAENAAEALSHANDADVARIAAQQSAANAEAAFDNFDDKYLGRKTEAPTVDNDGDPLQVGATYWHDYQDDTGTLFYWNGAEWEAPDKAASASAQAAEASATAALASEGAALAAKNDSEAAKVDAEAAAASSELDAEAAAQAVLDAEAAAGSGGLVEQEIRKREYAGSGFAEWGKAYEDNSASINHINEGLWSWETQTNQLMFGEDEFTSNNEGSSRTGNPVAIVDGVEHLIEGVNEDERRNRIAFPTAPDGSKSLNPNTGEVHKYHDLAGVGTEYEAHTVDFDGSTYIDLRAVPYNTSAGSTFEFKFKWDTAASANQYIFDTQVNRAYLYKQNTDLLAWGGLTNVMVNGEPTNTGTLTLESGVEYHITGEFTVATSLDVIGARYTNDENWTGQIWDITLASNEDGVEPVHYNTAKFQPKADAAPVVTTVDGGDNPDMDAGYYVDYNDDGEVTIPEFPLADSMDISLTVRLDEKTTAMNFGQLDAGSRLLYYYSVNADELYMYVGGDSFQSINDEKTVADKYYNLRMQIRKNDGQSDYTVTCQINDNTPQTRTAVTFGKEVFDNFKLGWADGTTGSVNRWDGIIKDFTITYPDSPDLNRSYSSFESSDPSGRLTVTDDLGFTTEDWTPDFGSTGSNQRVEFTPWGATTAGQATVEFMYRWDVANSVVILNSTEQTGNFLGAISNAGNLYWSDVDFTDVHVNGASYSRNSYVVSVGETIHVKATIATTDTLNAVGGYGGGFELHGDVWDVRLTDLVNPANSRHYPLVINSATKPDTLVAVDEGYDKDTAPFYTPDWDGYNNYVSIPELTQDTGDIVEFNLVCPHADEGWCVMLSGGTDDLAINSTGNWTFSGGTLTVDGVAVTSGTPADLNTETKRVVYTRTTTRTLLKFGASTSGGNTLGTNWRMWDITITDVSDPTNSRYYPSLVYSPDAVPTGTVLEETLKPNKCTNGGFSSDVNGWDAVSGSVEWVASYQGNNGVLRLNDSGSWTHAYETDVALEVGKRYTISVVVRHDSGGTINYNFYNTRAVDGSDIQETVSVPSGSWTAIEAEFVAISADWGIGADGTVPVHFNNVVVTAHDDGTLVNFPANNEWTLAQVDGATDGTLENFTVGSEWDNDLPITDGTMVGFTQPWKYNTGRYTANIVGNTTFTPMTIQDAQKCFLEAKYTDFEPIISRKDLVFLETWKEEVVGFMCPLGGTQFGGSSHDGAALVDITDFVAQGYSAFGEWDTDTVGKVVAWDSLTTAEQNVWRSNPKNNIVFEEGKTYQYRYRIRVVEGLTDETDINEVMPTSVNYYLRFYTAVKAQGSFTESFDYYPNAATIVGYNNGNPLPIQGSEPVPETSLWKYRNTTVNNGITVDGKGGVIPIALVQRLNQGAYHPTWNSAGCGSWVPANSSTGRQDWYGNGVDNAGVDNTEQCFTAWSASYGKPLLDSRTGNISDGSVGTGRSDQYDYYDAIYAGQVEDLRLNANKQNKQELLTDAVRRGVRGETRGKGKVPFTTVRTIDSTTNLGRTTPIAFVFVEGNPNQDYVIGDRAYAEQNDGSYREMEVTDIYSGGAIEFFSVDGQPFDRLNGGHMLLMNELSAEYDSLPWVDIIGDPVRIAATFPDGVVGQWIDTVPDSVIDTFYLNKKSDRSTAVGVYTSDDGATWGTSTYNLDTVINTLGIRWSVGDVALIYYEALSDFTESDDNRAVVGDLGDVQATMFYLPSYGNRLMPSLIGEIAKNSREKGLGKFSVTSHEYTDQGELSPSQGLYYPTHTPVDLIDPNNDSNAVKALPHLVEKDGLLYVQWHGTQLVYDNGSFVPWGDDSEVTIVDDESTKNDLNDNEVKVVTHTELIPVGIANKNETL